MRAMLFYRELFCGLIMIKTWFAVGVILLAGCSSQTKTPPVVPPPQPAVAPVQNPAPQPVAQTPANPQTMQPDETMDQWAERLRESPGGQALLAEKERKEEEAKQANWEKSKEQLRQNREAAQRDQEVRVLRSEQNRLEDQSKELSRKNPDFVQGGSEGIQRANDQRDLEIREKQRQIDRIQNRR